MKTAKMSRYIAFIALACAIYQTVQAAPADKLDCDKFFQVLDDLGGAQGITSLNDKYKIPQSIDEHTKRCAEMTDAIKSLRRYNNQCTSALTQQVLATILRTRHIYNERYCKDPTSAEYKSGYEAARCAAQQAFDKVREAETQTILSFQALHGDAVADDKLRVRRACCAVLDSKRTFLEATQDKCAEHGKIYASYVDSYMEEAMSLICPSADKLQCDVLEPISTDGVKAKTKFFLTPLIRLIKTLDH